MKQGTLVAVAVAVGLVAACGNGPISESHGDTSTTPASIGRPVAAKEIDSLVIPVEQVPGGLHAESVENQPRQESSDDCFVAYSGVDSISPIAFRSVRYSGMGNLYVLQSVGIYLDNADAGAVFQRLTNRLRGCSPESGGASITPTEASWHAQGFSPVKGAQETSKAADERVVKNVVFSVVSGHFDNAEQTAASIADQIEAKINNPA